MFGIQTVFVTLILHCSHAGVATLPTAERPCLQIMNLFNIMSSQRTVGLSQQLREDD